MLRASSVAPFSCRASSWKEKSKDKKKEKEREKEKGKEKEKAPWSHAHRIVAACIARGAGILNSASKLRTRKTRKKQGIVIPFYLRCLMLSAARTEVAAKVATEAEVSCQDRLQASFALGCQALHLGGNRGRDRDRGRASRVGLKE